MMDQQERQRVVMALVREAAVSSQAQLVRALRERGFRTTQASVSRDVRALGLVKSGGRYVRAADLVDRDRRVADRDPVYALVREVVPVGAHLVVIKTGVGAANSVAVELDRAGMPEVAGTVAGDDTIFVAVRSRSDQGRLVARLNGAVAAATRG